MLRIWQDKLKRRHATTDIDATLADIAKTGEEIQQMTGRPMRERSSRLPVTQPAPVIAVTNTVLSPVMQESRPRETTPIWPERAVPCRERHRSMIDPSQVREATRLANNPPNQVHQKSPSPTDDTDHLPILRVTSPDQLEARVIEMDRSEDEPLKNYPRKTGIVEISEKSENSHRAIEGRSSPSVNTNKQSPSVLKNRFIGDCMSISSCPPLGVKAKELEMNDEGFEETQSLVSETLSQETSSGNYETDTHDSPRCSPASELTYIAKKVEPTERRRTIGKDEIARLKAFGPRAGSMKLIGEKSSFLPKRTGSLKRDVPPRIIQTNKRILQPLAGNSIRNDVERSGSRSSLRSSRSSLNSSTSVNTVRKLTPSHAQLGNYTNAICAMTTDLRKNPTNTSLSACATAKDSENRRSTPRINSSRIPASRSSSSGSSVGPVTRSIRKVGTVHFYSLSMILQLSNFNEKKKLFPSRYSAKNGKQFTYLR